MREYNRFVALLLMLALLPVTVFAAENIQVDVQPALTVSARCGNAAIAGMEFQAYRIASVEETGELTVTTSFSAYAKDLDIRGKNDGAWSDLADGLEREILLNSALFPDATVKTDSDGSARFGNLPVGLYLVLANGVENDGYVYTASSFFVMLPTLDKVNNSWNYQVSASAKVAENPVKADFEVIKIWKDDCHKEKRPVSIAVDLLCDGELYDTVTLPHNGHWRYLWQNLDVNHKWTVTEKQQEGYGRPEIAREGNTFILINTCNKPPRANVESLPQTGQLWWPVPVLLSAGMLFVIIGLLRRRRAQDET